MERASASPRVGMKSVDGG
uniref:Uncharacterized protein n=1 Tax=Arundo donax TaxID=35708 RepID=A0A0A9AVA7_ARUDO